MKLLKKFLNHFPSRYQIRLETLMKGSDFIFDSMHLLYYKCHKINLNRCGSYINSPDWIKKKRAIVNPVNITGKEYITRHEKMTEKNFRKIIQQLL